MTEPDKQQATSNASILVCPVCRQSLHADSHDLKHWACANGHSFDRARQGYLNLLLAHKKRSRAPGDTLEMVEARQRLLDSQVYQPISDLLNQQLQTFANTTHAPCQLSDVGCGEGYYTQRLQQHLQQAGIDNQIIGVDISKEAVRWAARRGKKAGSSNAELEWLVASGADLPFQPASLDAITCLFTRLMPDGFAKVLKPQGQVFTINTGLKHLREMREILYQDVKDSCFNPLPLMEQHGFFCVDEKKLSYQVTLDNAQQIQDLLLMTPHAWKANSQARQALNSRTELTVTIDVTLHQFAQNGEQA